MLGTASTIATSRVSAPNIMSRGFAIAAVLVSLMMQVSAQQPDTPLRADSEARAAFIKSQHDGCVQGMSYGPMVEFCTCYAQALADVISGDEQQALAAGQITDSLHKKLRRIGAECKASHFR